MQPVRQLDDDDAPVVGHRDEHGAQVLRLLVGGVGEGVHLARHLGQLGHLGLALDQPAHGRAKDQLDVGEVEHGVLHRVMQQAGRDRVPVHLGTCLGLGLG